MTNSEKDNEKIPNQVKVKIIRFLLANPRLSHREIADLCGYENREKNRYRYVTTPLKQLIDDEYLEKKIEPQVEKSGAPRTVYWIKPDIHTLKSLYFNDYFHAIKKDFQKSTWIRNLILQENFKISINVENFLEDMHMMLENSANFFEIFLNNQYHEENIFKLESTSICPITNKSEIYEGRTIECRSDRISFMLYSLFITCIIVDYIDKGKLDRIPSNVQEIGKEIKKKARISYKKIQQYQDTFEIMDALKCLLEVNGDQGIPTNIMHHYEEYQSLLEILGETDDKINPGLCREIEKKLDFIYDSIAFELSLPYRRRKREDYEILDVDVLGTIDPDKLKKIIEDTLDKKVD